MNKNYNTSTVIIIKKAFVIFINRDGYDKAVIKVSNLFGKSWELYKNEVMQWYDFEILKVRGDKE